MVNVLVDDKQAPVVANLEDITIYCDGAPDYAGSPDCDKRGDPYGPSTWPGQLKDFKGVIHGYYGGSAYLGIHVAAGEHEDPQACEGSRGWAQSIASHGYMLIALTRQVM
ncbi:MAG: hypothetical protein IPK94_07250 [Saprospiraceae bacterium]|nr:hypothetical protein [Saprospiraceae bacterium]